MRSYPSPSLVLWFLVACTLCSAGCGDDSQLAGAAGMQAIPGVGEPCVTQCDSGFVCERMGPFAGVCSASCNSDAACGLLVQGSICVAGRYNKCARRCTTTDDCAQGTACVTLENRMVCTATALQQ